MNHITDKIVAFLPADTIEPEALEQIKNTATLLFLYRHVAVMPDTHFGKGSTVGTVLPTKGAIVPAAVGVDIGCGMIAVKTNLTLEQLGELAPLLHSIERSVPMSAGRFNNKITESAQKRITELEGMSLMGTDAPGVNHYDAMSKNWREQLGTLGGGNHFIEICLDELNTVWVTLHSGSRGIGNRIGNVYIKKAQDICKAHFIELADPDLAYLVEGTEDFNDYIRDMRWAQHFAMLNREEMMDRVLRDISYHVFKNPNEVANFEVERINCHHNFTQIEEHFGEKVWVTRKGAIEAAEGKKGMIPGSMGTRSYIVSGLGNKMAFNSAPHGAGRRMSRAKAKASFTMDDFDKAMVGIEHRRTDVLIDELPMAYKDIDAVMENAKELVKIEATLKQILNAKGD